MLTVKDYYVSNHTTFESNLHSSTLTSPSECARDVVGLRAKPRIGVLVLKGQFWSIWAGSNIIGPDSRLCCSPEGLQAVSILHMDPRQDAGVLPSPAIRVLGSNTGTWLNGYQNQEYLHITSVRVCTL